MVFNSIEFAIFLPIVFLLYWFVFSGIKLRNWNGNSSVEYPRTCGGDCHDKSAMWQNLLLVAASFTFYSMWDLRFLGLIIFTILVTYSGGLFVSRRKSKSALAFIIVLTLLPLLVFKYHNFFVSSLASLIPAAGADRLLLKLILPVGISFYTFSALSYTIDVYQGKIDPTHDLLGFAAYVSFFPQLLSGPIGRSTDLLPQYAKARTFDAATAADGLRMFLWGLFKKVVIADGCATYVDRIWGGFQTQSGSTLLLAAILYSIQIYGDFSGYSDMAIGTARLFGIRLKQNFNYPYFSRDIAEFWRRWHISLTSWFREYIYFPLGGSRCSKVKILRNTAIVFLVSGLWHGANWTFVIWGAYHALLLIILILLGKSKRYKDTVAQGHFLPSVKEFCQLALTFALATLGWIIFRADSISQAMDYISGICSRTVLSVPACGGISGLFLCILVMTAVEWLQRNRRMPLELPEIKCRGVRWAIYIAVIFLIVVFGGHSVNFIYFQF